MEGIMEECPICFDIVPLITLHKCLHNVCNPCAIRCCVSFGMQCPLCRQVVHDISPSTYKHDIMFRISNGRHAGITLTNVRFGVVITNVNSRDEACHYVKKGDVVTHINGMPAVHHRDVITIIDECTRLNSNISLKLLTKKESFYRNAYDTVKKIRKKAQSFHSECAIWNNSHTEM